MLESDKKIDLEGQDAIDLWLKGKDSWNAWVKENPVADVDFYDMDFSEYRDHPFIKNDEWPFSGFAFPTGAVSFIGTSFGKGDVHFSGVSFGDGEVSFFGSSFGNGYISFYETSFGDGQVDFSSTTFGDGGVSFHDTSFGDGDVSFFGSSFGDGDVIFEFASFGKGEVDFNRTLFGKGEVSFGGTLFGDGLVNFCGVSFGEGHVNFWKSSFGDGAVHFESVDFEGRVDFSDLENVSAVKNFTFAHSTFQNSLSISSDEPFGCVVDLTSTKMSNQVSLAGLQCSLRKTKAFLGSEWLGKAKALNVRDIERFRRLKEIAGNNKDHEQALYFNVMEMQAKRWHKTTIAGLFFEFVFQASSNYGRSEIRAFLWMVFVCAACSRAYLYWSDTMKDQLCEPSGKMWASITFSIGQMLSFVPISRTARIDGAKCLFRLEQLPVEVVLLAFAQSLISIILIFLIGLSLRNRFKV
ncbi:MAG: hypothetical protein COB78_04270 [Hyphomicrobiales bacterium]|nr:MAG: hypothetical protein COB78_04270 [Hyphomicrobiales bacterium]